MDRLYIPTYDRVGKQLAFDSLPNKWKDKAILVVHPDEVHEGYPTLSCPVQGTGIAPVREWIAQHGQGTRYGVIDDDIEFLYTRKEDEEGPSNIKLDDNMFDSMINIFNDWMDMGYMHCGADASWNPPTRDKDHKECGRICGNVFYDGERLPVDDIDWTGLPIAEDYYVTLQLLTMGFPNMISYRARVNPNETQAKGGCSTFRSLEIHNESMRELQRRFPQFVKLREKIAKNSGEWSNKVKLAATISWKEAYKSSQVSTITDFMV